jgi:hypothetical protein
MLSLSQRPCKLDEKYGGKKLPGANVRTLKLGLREIPIDENELNALFGQAHAYRSIYDTGSDPITPYLQGIKAHELEDAWENAHVVLWYEMGATKIELKKAKLTKIRVTPREGGESWLAVSIEGEPPLNRKLAEIIERTGTDIECEISAASKADQQQLALNRFGGDSRPPVGGIPETH